MTSSQELHIVSVSKLIKFLLIRKIKFHKADDFMSKKWNRDGILKTLFWVWENDFRNFEIHKIRYKVLLTLICKSWKTHPEIFLKFSFSGSSHRPFYWKTHPDNFSKFQFWGVTQTVLLENSSRPNVTYHIWFQSKNSYEWVF